jgi:hypothetical protein
MPNLLIPPCPFHIGQHVTVLEDDEQPEAIGLGVVIGYCYQPGAWHLPGWVLDVITYDLPQSPWLTEPSDEEYHESNVKPCDTDVPEWAIAKIQELVGLDPHNSPFPEPTHLAAVK